MRARLIWAFALAAALMTHAQTTSWNESSRLAAIESLVDRGTFAIDDSPIRTGDKYRYRGHFYSDKPVFFPIAGAAIAAPLRALHVGFGHRTKFVTIALTVALVAIPFGLGIGALFGLLRFFGADERRAAAVATIAGSATLALPFATILINHVPAAALLLGALLSLARARATGGPARVAFAGGCLGFAVGLDTSYVLFLVLAPIALGRANVRAYGAYALGALVPLLALAAANFALSGNVRPPDTNTALFDFPGSAFAHGNLAGGLIARTPAGLATYAFNVLVGTRGLFLYSPILSLGVYALWRRLRSSERPDRRPLDTFVAIAASAYVLVAIVATIDYGGDAYGMRTLVGVSWLLCIPLATLPWTDGGGARRTLLLTLVAISIAFALLGTLDPFIFRPFPLLDIVADYGAFARAHRAHAVYDLVVRVAIGVAAFVAIRRLSAAEAVSKVPFASSLASKR